MRQQNIPLDELEQGPIRHPELSHALVARIKKVQLALDEVYPSSLADWLDDFRRDLHPEEEVVWWERLAQCYLIYRDERVLSASQRQPAFKVLLNISLGGHSDSLSADATILPKGVLGDLQALLREHGL
jgi:hypothetical protein